jgi:hypothetical protein
MAWTSSWTGSSFVATYVYYSGVLVNSYTVYGYRTPRNTSARLFCFPREKRRNTAPTHHIGSPLAACILKAYKDRLRRWKNKRRVAAVAHLCRGRCTDS